MARGGQSSASAPGQFGMRVAEFCGAGKQECPVYKCDENNAEFRGGKGRISAHTPRKLTVEKQSVNRICLARGPGLCSMTSFLKKTNNFCGSWEYFRPFWRVCVCVHAHI